MTTTTPAPELDSAVRIKVPSTLALVAMGLGLSATEALALVAARAAEDGRVAELGETL